jgi:hypothetical protein
VHPDQRGALVLGAGVEQGRLHSGQVVDVGDRGHVPAVRAEAGVHVLGGERQLGAPVDRDVVVVVDVHQPAEREVTGEGGRLGGHALHQVTVRADREHAVIAHLGPVALTQEPLGHRHPDAVGKALAERAGGRLHARREATGVALRVARGP